jgi:hypothetical protein
MKALLQWLTADPHLDSSGDLVTRAILLQICLGVGIIAKDAHLIQFTEGKHTNKIPRQVPTSSNLQMRSMQKIHLVTS